MSLSTLLIPLIAILIIYGLYRKTLIGTGADSIIKNAKSADKLNPLARPKLYIAMLTKEYLIIVSLIFVFNFLIIFANLKLNFLNSWVILVATAPLWILCVWLLKCISRHWETFNLYEKYK